MIQIKPVLKNDQDAQLIMKWRNDPVTCKNSFRETPFSWHEFKSLFYNKYFENQLPPLFVLYQNKKIAFIGSTNIEPDRVNISINIDPSFRGRNLATPILQKALHYVKNNSSVRTIDAEIKSHNKASIKSFQNVGFLFKDSLEGINHYQLTFHPSFFIDGKSISSNSNTYIIAELSCNHNQNITLAYQLIDAAAQAGADAVKLQTYTADTMTLPCDKPIFKDCLNGTLWEGKSLYELYSKAYTPWEWHKDLKNYANKKGMDLFSSPFDTTAVDFLESINIPVYKIASFEITDHILIKRIAQTGKPVIISSGMASLQELQEAVSLLRDNGCPQIAILKCTSAYPAKPEDANLSTIQHLINTFNVVVGLSDHTLGIEVPIASVVLGARIIEKHFKLSDNSGSEDDAFSLTPTEFKQMVDAVRKVEKTIGIIKYNGTQDETKSKIFRRSLFVVKDVQKDELFTEENVKSIRPSNGLHTKHYDQIIGKKSNQNISFGTPFSLDFVN